MKMRERIARSLLKSTPSARFAGYNPNTGGIASIFSSDILASTDVRVCIGKIASEISKAKVSHTVNWTGTDEQYRASNLQQALDSPNRYQTSSDFLAQTVWQLCQYDNAFILPIWNNTPVGNVLTELIPVLFTSVQYSIDANTSAIQIQFTLSDGRQVGVNYFDLIHIRKNYSRDFLLGGTDTGGGSDNRDLLSLLKSDEKITHGLADQTAIASKLSGIVRVNSMLVDEDSAKIVDQFINSFDGTGIGRLDMKAEYIPVAKQSRFIDSESVKFINQKIYRSFGVPENIANGSYSSEEYEAFFQSTLEPLLNQMSQAFTKRLLTEDEQLSGHRINFYPQNLAFLSMSQKLEVMQILGNTGAIFENEKRSMVGLAPLRELEGVRFMQSSNYLQLGINDPAQIEGQPAKSKPATKNVPRGTSTKKGIK